MKQKIALLFFSLLSLNIVLSQSISPLETTEQCPLTNITFTVIIPGEQPIVSSDLGAPTIVTGVNIVTTAANSTTFTFVGRFVDANATQAFRVNYKDENGVNKENKFYFKRIKSLFYGACSLISPQQTSIIVPRCEIVNTNITFNNVQFKNNFESPTLCFGTITTYEYQLPVGWSMNGTTSTGTNWIPGDNTETVTSNASNGNGEAIKVRPVNTGCGSGLANTSSITNINISRPEPTNIQIQGSQFYICSGSTSFSLANLPSGASVLWELTDYTNASISGANNQSSVTIQRNTSTNALVEIKATITHCTYTYVYYRTITLGNATEDYTFTSLYNTVNIDGYPYVWATTVEIPNALYYNWYYKKHTGPGPGGGTGGTFQFAGSTTTNHFEFTLPECDMNYTIKSEATTPCGTVVTPLPEGLLFADCGGTFAMSLAPNPTSSTLNIALPDKKQKIVQYEVQDKTGIIVQKGTGSKDYQHQINVGQLTPGYYFIRVFNGTKWVSKSFIKQ